MAEVKGECKLNPCACGCGTMVPRNFAPGHDSKLRSLINQIRDGKRPMSDLPAIAAERLDPCPDCNMPNVHGHRHGPKLAEKRERSGPQTRKADEEASEHRLKAYFFGELWENIPEKAQESLINVDEVWLSRAWRRDYGAVLNHLRLAAESMCHTFIWKPLRKSPGNQTFLRILDRYPELRGRDYTPSLLHYDSICREQGFEKFVQEQGVSGVDRQFLLQDLPIALHRLRKLRREAEHGPERIFARSEVKPLVHFFLGVGGFGILRRLAEVGPKLNSKP